MTASASRGSTATRERGRPTTTAPGGNRPSAPCGCSARLCRGHTRGPLRENSPGRSSNGDPAKRQSKRNPESSSSTSGTRSISESDIDTAPVVDVVEPYPVSPGLSRRTAWEQEYSVRLTYDIDNKTPPTKPDYARRSASGTGWHGMDARKTYTAREAWVKRLMMGDDPLRVAMDILRYAHYPERHRAATVSGMVYDRKLIYGRLRKAGAWKKL